MHVLATVLQVQLCVGYARLLVTVTLFSNTFVND